MSTTIHAYVVDIERLSRVFGSNDVKLLNVITDAYGKEIQDRDLRLAPVIAEGAPSLKEALQEIVAGRLSRAKHALIYSYAFELLVRHFGKRLPDDWFDSIHGGYESEVGLLDPVFAAGIPMPIPQPHAFPEIGHFTASQAKEQFEKHRSADLSHPEPEVTLGREQVLEWLEEAVRRKQGLVIIQN